MNSRSLSGVLMLGGAAALAWAWLTGRLDRQIAQVTAQVRKVAPATASSSGASGLGPSGKSGAGAGGGGGGSW